MTSLEALLWFSPATLALVLSCSGTSDENGAAGSTAPACAAPEAACGSTCVDVTTDGKNCGKCGNTCAVACSGGACVDKCPSGTENCSGACVDVTKNASNCGGCGKACAAGQVCEASKCSCGSNVPSFASLQNDVFSKSCVDAGCHAGARPKEGLDLSTAAKSYSALVNAAGPCGKLYVVPGDVSKSYLVNKLTGVGMCGGSQMPKAGQSLPAKQLDGVRAWICAGAKQ